MLCQGRFDLTDSGAMDRTHFRWFTPATYAEMFEAANFRIIKLEPVSEPGPKGKVIQWFLPRRAHHILWRQINLIAECAE